MKGLWKYLSPFAPDQSGATAVLCEMGGLIVIIDAGGCAGNICGFDEPRWFEKKSAIFSAGLRDMDAILGRDDRLVEKIQKACQKIEGNFIALIGTPVPAVIGTDYKALKRMLEARTGIPVLALNTCGVRYYDVGCEKAWMALFEEFTEKSYGMNPGSYGIIGATPFDGNPEDFLQESFSDKKAKVFCYGLNGSIDAIRQAGQVMKNYVVAPSALKAARYLAKRFGVPYEIQYPLDRIPGHASFIKEMKSMISSGKAPGRVLIVHQQVLAHTLRLELEQFMHAQIMAATWFMMDPEIRRPGDVSLKEEDDWLQLVREGDFDLIIADELLGQAVPDYKGRFIPLNHFPISGKSLSFPDYAPKG